MGILPPAGLREDAGFDVETVEDDEVFLGANLAVGGLLTGVEAAIRQNCLSTMKKCNYNHIQNRILSDELQEHTCCLRFGL